MSQVSALMTVREVAEVFRVSDETIHRWCREGELAYVPVGGGLKRFRREYIEERAEAQQQNNPTERDS